MNTIEEIMNDKETLRQIISHIHDGIDYLDDKHSELLEDNPELSMSSEVVSYLFKFYLENKD